MHGGILRPGIAADFRRLYLEIERTDILEKRIQNPFYNRQSFISGDKGMKKELILAAAAILVSFSLTGCVKVIDKGTEGQYTGEVAFDASADSSGDWGQISQEITDNAKEV